MKKLLDQASRINFQAARYKRNIQYVPARNKEQSLERRYFWIGTLIARRINGARDASLSGDFVREPLYESVRRVSW